MAKIVITKAICEEIIKHGTPSILDFRQRFKHAERNAKFGHMIGKIKNTWTQNQDRTAQVKVTVNGTTYLCDSPFTQPGEQLLSGQVVGISKNLITGNWDVFGGECAPEENV